MGVRCSIVAPQVFAAAHHSCTAERTSYDQRVEREERKAESSPIDIDDVEKTTAIADKVSRIISTLRPFKAPGWDKIHSKLNRFKLINRFADIANACLCLGHRKNEKKYSLVWRLTIIYLLFSFFKPPYNVFMLNLKKYACTKNFSFLSSSHELFYLYSFS